MFGLFNKKSNEKLKEYLAHNALLVDVRTPEEFSSGSAKDAINIPLQVFESRMDELKNKGKVIVFCRSGNRSGQAKQILENAGFTEVVNGGSLENVLNELATH